MRGASKPKPNILQKRRERPLPGGRARGHRAVELLRGSADIRMSTDEVMALTRDAGRGKAGASRSDSPP